MISNATLDTETDSAVRGSAHDRGFDGLVDRSCRGANYAQREPIVPRTNQGTTERIRCSHIDTDAVLAAIEFLLDISADLSPADRGVLLRAAQELLDLGPSVTPNIRLRIRASGSRF